MNVKERKEIEEIRHKPSQPSTMRLSEAIMLGASVGTLNPQSWCTCLLGQAVRALGYGSDSLTGVAFRDMCLLWPWLDEDRLIDFPAFYDPTDTLVWDLFYPVSGRSTTRVIISNLAYAVERGKYTREQVADWVRSIEPDPPVEVKEATEVEITEKESVR